MKLFGRGKSKSAKSNNAQQQRIKDIQQHMTKGRIDPTNLPVFLRSKIQGDAKEGVVSFEHGDLQAFVWTDDGGSKLYLQKKNNASGGAVDLAEIAQAFIDEGIANDKTARVIIDSRLMLDNLPNKLSKIDASLTKRIQFEFISTDVREMSVAPTATTSSTSTQGALEAGSTDTNDKIKLLPDQWWKLFIDKDRQGGGDLEFDQKEPGYRDAMMAAMKHMLSTLDRKMDVDGYVLLHDTAVNGVRTDALKSTEIVKGLTEDPVNYGFGKADVSKLALRELNEEGVLYVHDVSTNKQSEYDSTLLGSTVMHNTHRTPAQIKERINTLFRNYYQSIESAQNDNEKLEHIVRLCRALEVGHYFRDGNQRTVAFLLLNKLLIENGFTPVILENPYDFDGYKSINDLVQEVRKGMANFSAEVSK